MNTHMFAFFNKQENPFINTISEHKIHGGYLILIMLEKQIHITLSIVPIVLPDLRRLFSTNQSSGKLNFLLFHLLSVVICSIHIYKTHQKTYKICVTIQKISLSIPNFFRLIHLVDGLKRPKVAEDKEADKTCICSRCIHLQITSTL